MATNPDVAAILAALQGAGGASNAPSYPPPQQYSTPQPVAQQYSLPPGSVPPPAYTGVIPTPPAQGYPPYGLPQPAASGHIDLNSIKPVSHGNVNFQDALSKVQGFAAARGVPPMSNGPPRQDPRLAGRPVDYRSRSRSPPRNYNPYRDERRDDPRRHAGYGRDRSRSPPPPPQGGRNSFEPQRDRDAGRDDPDSEVISIESNLVGLVIGRGGDNLKRIERESGARIQFITGPQHNGPQRECRLSGPERNRLDAKHAIWRILDENGGHGTALMSQQPSTPINAGNPPRGAPLPAVNQPKLREGENSVQIMVPDKTVGLIIGRGGETIRDLQEKSQCHINIVGENKSVNGLRPVNLIGSAQASQRARELILEIVDSDTRNQELAAAAAGGRPPPQQERAMPMAMAQPDKSTETIRVPSDSVGMIIGKGGETIKDMQSQTGCKINVHQASGRDVERPIDLVGDRAAIERARAAIWDKVEQVKEKNRGHQDGRSQGRDAGNPYAQQQQQHQQSYAQQAMPGQAIGAAPGGQEDPYAPYGGYANYVKLWQDYQAQQGAGGAPAQ